MVLSVECYGEGSGSGAETSEIGNKQSEKRRTEEISAASEGWREQSNSTSTFKNVVNLSRRVLTEPEVSLLSKGLKLCPTPKKVDLYLLRKNIKDYIRLIQLKEYFHTEDDVGGDFSEIPAFRKKSGWSPDRNCLFIPIYISIIVLCIFF